MRNCSFRLSTFVVTLLSIILTDHYISTYHWSQVEMQQCHWTGQWYDPTPIHRD